jgi:hypothetical protein
MSFVKLRRAVHAVADPEHLSRLPEDGGATEIRESLLDILEVLGVPPDHEVGVSPHTGGVVDASHLHSSLLSEFRKERGSLLRCVHAVIGKRPRRRTEHRPLGVALNLIEFDVVELGH